MIDYLHRLQNLIQKKHLSVLVYKRLIRDLEAIHRRLKKDEYETSGIVENVFDVQDKTHQLYKLLETYTRIAKTWSRALSKIPIHNFKEIVDICPGFAPKVEIGLFYLNYKGKVILFDKDLESIRQLMKFMELFNQQFIIVPYPHDLFTPLKKRFSFVIGNHIIDDIILNYYTKKLGQNIQTLYEKEGELIKVWDKILENEQNNFTEITEKLTKIFAKLIKKGGYLCLSQYRSYLERMLDLEKSYKFSQKVYHQLIIKLLASGFTKANNLKNELEVTILKNG